MIEVSNDHGGTDMNKIKNFAVLVIKLVAVLVMIAVVVAGGTLNGYAASGDASFNIDEGTDARIAEYVDEFRDKIRCNSVSAVVVTPDGTEVYGDADALYQIGSMTKAFTGLAVQKLISEGALSESNNVSELIPGYETYYNSEPCEITIGQLLSQTSGYTNKESDYPSATEEMSLQDWAYSISGKELASKPGEEYAYSNVNYDLLGAIIEQVSGKSYAEYMRTEILDPLGLTHTYAQVPEAGADIISGSRLGYRHSFRYEIPVIEGRIPAGYFFSNANDMAKWIEIWIGTAEIPEEYKELISTVKARLNGVGDYYSGWELFENGVIGHSGGTPNFSSRIVFSDDEKTGVCVLTNLNVAASTDGLCSGIYELAAGSKHADPAAPSNDERLDPDAGRGDTDSNAGREAMVIPTDVWTVFDIIFSAISAVAITAIVAVIFMKRRGAILGVGITLLVLLMTVCIVMPIVFGAGLGEIAFTWAPYSFAGSLILMALGVLASGIRFFMIRQSRR